MNANDSIPALSSRTSALSPGARIRIGGQDATVLTVDVDNSHMTVDINGTTLQYLADFESRTLWDDNGIQSSYFHLEDSRMVEATLSEAIASGDSVLTDTIVESMVFGPDLPQCRCPRCLLRMLSLLRNLMTRPPPTDECAIAAVYIASSMIPRLQSRIEDAMIEVVANAIASGQSIDDVLAVSMDDGPQRTGAKSEVVDALSRHVKPYSPLEHERSGTEPRCCVFCLDPLQAVAEANAKANRPPLMVITCPGCNNSFCAGSEQKECAGFRRHMEDDHRCPVCRSPVREWVFEAVASVSCSPELDCDISHHHRTVPEDVTVMRVLAQPNVIHSDIQYDLPQGYSSFDDIDRIRELEKHAGSSRRVKHYTPRLGKIVQHVKKGKPSRHVHRMSRQGRQLYGASRR